MPGKQLIAVVLFVLCIGSNALAQEPRFEIDSAEFHFGKVFEGNTVRHTFNFRNAGSAPLIINRVRSSCGCTVTRLSAEILSPGDTGEIEMAFDTSRYRGQQVQTIYLYTNDPRREVIQLSLHGMVEQIIVAEPSRIDYGAVKSGESAAIDVVLSSRIATPITLSHIRLTHPDMQAELSQDVLQPGTTATLTLRVLPSQDRGRLSGYVVIATDHPGLPEMRIAVFGMVTP